MSNIIEITEYSAVELDMYARLNEAQLLHYYEPELGLFITESPLVIGRALDAGYEPVSFLMEKKHIDGDAKDLLARCPDTPVYTAERDVLEQLTGYVLTRGVLCAMRRPPARDVEAVLKTARRVAVLEGVVDSTNIGAIFRSAAALGMDAVLLTSTCCDPLNRRAVRVSMGTVFQVPWATQEDWMQTLHDHGFKTAAMALDERAISIEDEALQKEEKLAVFMGTEGDGLNKETIEKCDYTVMIPMCHGVDSLNVAAASAVAFWQLRAK